MSSTRAVAAAMLAAASISLALPAAAQRAPGRAVSTSNLRRNLSVIAADSMGGRDTGSRGDYLTAELIAAEFRRLGLRPAGEGGTFFQVVPFVQVHADTTVHLVVGGKPQATGTDVFAFAPVRADGLQAVYGGMVGDSDAYPAADVVKGRLVVLTAPAGVVLRRLYPMVGAAWRRLSGAGAAALAVAALERVPADLREQLLQGRVTTDTTALSGPPILLVSTAAAAAMLGAPPDALKPGAPGGVLSGGIAYRRDPLAYPARNVVAVLPGSDPTRATTFVSVSAHNDHVGLTGQPVDHDSVYAHNHVLRPLGADSPDRDPTATEAARIAAIRDSLRRVRPDRPDSVFNGADDDGSGTVALLEIARVLAAAPRPRRSVLFVSHVAEERGLLGSAWFTDHPKIPRDSIIGEIDMDMVGRGRASDLPEGGSAYLESVGSRRLSREFGDLLEQVNARQPLPFRFNYAYDAPGHPLQYYCRADHYSYARYGIPSVAYSRGEHADYHQVTDEAEYIDYDALARVAGFVADAVATLANLDHRPLVDGPRTDPHAPCRQ